LASAVPATIRTGWSAAMTAVSRATPIAPPIIRWALKTVDATLVRSAPTVAKPAAWLGRNTDATPNPMTNRMTRSSHALVPVPTKEKVTAVQAISSRPATMIRRGPIAG
jgi:hypothetical protein